tara:strand:- start:8 stop:196 length:189 start_codon:yes stop_codon:yes gene_type:complete
MKKIILGLVLVLGVTTFTSCEEESIVPQCERFYVVYDPTIPGYRSEIYYEDCAEGEESNIPN